jgi:hypothetical protein
MEDPIAPPPAAAAAAATISEDAKERIKRLEHLVEAGIMSQEEFEAKKEKIESEAQAQAVQNKPSRWHSYETMPQVSPHLTEENSPGIRIGAPGLLNEYFQHIKEEKPDCIIKVLPPIGYRLPTVTCHITCRIGGKVIEDSLCGASKKLVRSELALNVLKKLLPDFETPEDILANIKGMSSGIRHPLRRTKAEELLARGAPEYDPGPGRIESSLGDMGPVLPVVCGDADDISRVLQAFCETMKTPMPNLITHGYNEEGKLTASMDLTVRQDAQAIEEHGVEELRYFAYVEETDLASVRQEANLQILRQIFTGVHHKEALKVEIDKLKAEVNRKKQKTDAPAINPASFAASLLNFYCQVIRVRMPEVDANNQLSIRLPDGTVHTVNVSRMNKKIARAEACHRLMKLIFPEKDLNEVQAYITELQEANRAIQVQKLTAGAARRFNTPWAGEWSGWGTGWGAGKGWGAGGKGFGKGKGW